MIERVLSIGDGLIVSLPSEDKEGRMVCRGFFFRITAYQPYYWEYNKLGAMNKADSKNFNYLGEDGHGSGRDIFRVERDDFHVYHVWLSPNNPHLRVYKTISPLGVTQTALDRKKSTDWADPTKGSNFDFYTAKQIPNKFDPPEVAENLIFRAASDDDGKYFKWGFYAEENISESSNILYLLGRSYKLAPVTDADEMRAMAQQAITQAKYQTAKVINIQISGLNKKNRAR